MATKAPPLMNRRIWTPAVLIIKVTSTSNITMVTKDVTMVTNFFRAMDFGPIFEESHDDRDSQGGVLL